MQTTSAAFASQPSSQTAPHTPALLVAHTFPSLAELPPTWAEDEDEDDEEHEHDYDGEICDVDGDDCDQLEPLAGGGVLAPRSGGSGPTSCCGRVHSPCGRGLRDRGGGRGGRAWLKGMNL